MLFKYFRPAFRKSVLFPDFPDQHTPYCKPSTCISFIIIHVEIVKQFVLSKVSELFEYKYELLTLLFTAYSKVPHYLQSHACTTSIIVNNNYIFRSKFVGTHRKNRPWTIHGRRFNVVSVTIESSRNTTKL